MRAISSIFNEKTHAVAASGTVSASSPDIESERVVAYHVDLATSGANDLGDVSRIRLKAGSQTIWDLTPLQLRALIQRFSRSNFALSATATAFTLPLYHMDLKGDDRYRAHFPAGKKATLEIVFLATAVAGTCQIGYSIVSEAGDQYYKCLGQALNITGAATNAPFTPTQGGVLRALGLVTTNLTKVKLKLGGVYRLELSGRLFREAGTLENVETVTDPWVSKIHGPDRFRDGDGIYLDVAAGWTAGNEGLFYMLENQGVD